MLGHVGENNLLGHVGEKQLTWSCGGETNGSDVSELEACGRWSSHGTSVHGENSRKNKMR